jgi:WD40 repeat protein
MGVASTDGRALVFPRGKPAEATVLPHPGVNAVALSWDGRWAATEMWGRSKAVVKLWELPQGRYLRDLPVESSYASLMFSPDSRWLVVGDGRGFRFFRAGTWEPGLEIPMEHRSSGFGPIQFAPDGTFLAIALNTRTIRLVDSRDGRPFATLDNGNPAVIQSMIFSGSGRWLLVSRRGQSVQIWDLDATRRLLSEMGLGWDRGT